MNPSRTCPTREQLLEMASGVIGTQQTDELEIHILTCVACTAVIAEAMDRDPLSILALEAGWPPVPVDPETEELSRRITTAVGTRLNAWGETFISQSVKRDTELELSWLEPTASAEEIGRLGNFRVLKLLGRGGMGVVFEAEDIRLRRRVALKVMLPNRTGDRLGPERFLREARSAAAVHHPHVVTIYEVGESSEGSGNPVPYLAMERLRGETLQQRLAQGGRLSPAEAVEIARQTADGLAAAHRQGILHRDIKPSNIWLESDIETTSITKPRVKILDFGLAKPVDSSGDLTLSGQIVGTPGYLSPEQVSGAVLDARSDLFSLGCVLYEMLTGQAAFDGPTTLAKIRAIAVSAPTPVDTLNPDVSPDLVQLTHRLLADDPGNRPESADAVASELGRWSGRNATVVGSTARSVPLRRSSVNPAWGWLAGTALLAAIVITIRHRDGSETKVTIDTTPGATTTDAAVTPDETPRAVPSIPAIPDVPPKAPQAHSLSHLRAEDIPAMQRTAGQPPELVAVLGDQRLTEWETPFEAELHPSGDFLLPILERRVSQNVWSTKTFLPTQPFPAGEPRDGQAVFSPDGRFLFSAGKLFEVSGTIDSDLQIAPTARVKMDDAPWGGFSPDGRWLVTLNPDAGHFLIWDLSLPNPTGNTAGRWEMPGGPQLNLTITQAPPRLVVNSPRGQLAETWVYDWTLGESEIPQLAEPVRRTGRWVYARHAPRALELQDSGLVQLHDVTGADPVLVRVLRPTQGWSDQAAVRGDLTDDGKMAACIDGGVTVHLYRDVAGQEDRGEPELLLHQPNIMSFRFVSDGSRLCVTGLDGSLHWWDVARFPAQEQFRPPAGSRVDRLTMSPDGRFAGVAGWDGQTVYDLTASPPRRIEEITSSIKGDGEWGFHTAPALAVFPGREVWNLDLSPPQAVSRQLPNLERLFDPHGHELVNIERIGDGTRFEWLPWEINQRGILQLGTPTRTWSIPDRSFNLIDVQLQAGRMISADEKTGRIQIHAIGSIGTALHEYSGLPNNRVRQRISPSGRIALSWPSSTDPGRLWDLSETPPREYTLAGGYRWIDFTLDENQLLTADPAGGGVGLVDWRFDREIRKFTFPGIVDRVYMHPDGKHFLTVNRNGTVYVVRLGN